MLSRRHFHRHLLTAALAAPLWLNAAPASTTATALRRSRRPARLRAGDTVGLVTPGSAVSDTQIQQAYLNLEGMGLKVKEGAFIRQERGFTAGTDEQRLADLYAMFADDSVRAVWCIRGGYGTTRLLPAIDYRLLRRNGKILIGYSDITALLNAITERTGLVTFHGPMAGGAFTDYDKQYLREVLMEGRAPLVLTNHPDNLASTEPGYGLKQITPGRADGPLVGGNLSLLAAMLGTGYLPDAKGKIVFLEDVGERPYRIDRMLTQLRQGWKLEEAAGIAIGICADCQPKEDERSLGLIETLRDRLGDLGMPVVYGLSFGHISHQYTLPVGIRAQLDTAAGLLTLLEPAVE